MDRKEATVAFAQWLLSLVGTPKSPTEKQVFQYTVLAFNDILGKLQVPGLISQKTKYDIITRLLRLRSLWEIVLKKRDPKYSISNLQGWASRAFSLESTRNTFDHMGILPLYLAVKAAIVDETTLSSASTASELLFGS